MTQEKKKKEECYYPFCKKKGRYKYGREIEYFLFCEEHFHLTVFMQDLFKFFQSI